MPDIDPSALLNRSGSTALTSSTPIISTKSLTGSAPTTQKVSKSMSMAQRIDLEPLYTALKPTIGENWAAYKEAISRFILGKVQTTWKLDCVDIGRCYRS